MSYSLPPPNGDVSYLQARGFPVEALWGRTGAEAEKAAQRLGVTFHTSQVASSFMYLLVFGQQVGFGGLCILVVLSF